MCRSHVVCSCLLMYSSFFILMSSAAQHVFLQYKYWGLCQHHNPFLASDLSQLCRSKEDFLLTSNVAQPTYFLRAFQQKHISYVI